jgi:hypothetical protein
VAAYSPQIEMPINIARIRRLKTVKDRANLKLLPNGFGLYRLDKEG